MDLAFNFPFNLFPQIPFNGGADTVDPDYRDTVHNEAVGHKSDIEFMKKFIARYFPLLLSEPSIMETCMYTVQSLNQSWAMVNELCFEKKRA